MGFIKQIAIGLMIFSALGSTILGPMILMDFEIRRDYIAKEHCIDRDKPSNTCAGSCYLSQRLEKATQHHSDDKSVINPIINFTFFHQKVENIAPGPQSHILDQILIVYNMLHKPGKIIFDIFHPPRG